MNRSLLVPLVAALATATACGGSSSSGTRAFHDAAPSYSALSMDLTAADQTPPTLTSGATASALQASPDAATTAALVFPTDCHPHLFERTADVVRRVNRHVWRALRHVERVIATNPTLETGAEVVWEHVENGIDRKFTMTRTSDVLFTWKLELRKATDAAFVTVVSGSIDRTGATGPHQGKGSLTIDLGALASVNGDDVSGTLAATFDTFPASRTLAVTATDVVWDADANVGLVRAPRSATYVFAREPGKGGSLKVEEQMVFGCPANPGLLPADVKLVSRWFRTAAGSVHGRSDALMAGGQLPATNDLVGVTCHQSATEDTDQAESFWMMKVEDTTSTPPGNTIAGGSRESVMADSSACDPALGAVPSLTDASSDFGFAGVDFTSPAPYPIPGA